MKTCFVKKLYVLSLCLICFFIFSCESLDVMQMIDLAKAGVNAGTAIASATEEITPQQEYYIGRAVAANILTNYSSYTNEQLQGYLNTICQTLVINSDKPELYKGYRVQILDSEEINAFATSGGHILITRGLLECANSEDAVAAVIAHEIAHIQLQHGISAIKASRTTAAIAATAQVGLVASGNDNLKDLSDAFDEGINDILQTLVNTGYSQSQEFEADAMALSLMDKAGYSPHAMIDMLTLLEENEKGKSGGFLSTHPKAATRLDAVEDEISAYANVPIHPDRTNRFFEQSTSL